MTLGMGMGTDALLGKAGTPNGAGASDALQALPARAV